MEIQNIMNDEVVLVEQLQKTVNETKLCYRVCVSFVGFLRFFFFFLRLFVLMASL